MTSTTTEELQRELRQAEERIEAVREQLADASKNPFTFTMEFPPHALPAISGRWRDSKIVMETTQGTRMELGIVQRHHEFHRTSSGDSCKKLIVKRDERFKKGEGKA